MMGYRFTGFDATGEGKSRFEKLLDLFTQILTYTSGDASEALDWMNQLDRKYQLTDSEYGMGDFIDDLKANYTIIIVTHSMQQAVNLGDRIVMMHKGRVLHDFDAREKRRLRVDDLLAVFENVRRKELLDESAAELLRRQYV